jgi:glycerol-3-phosphate O-acyltransferase
LANFAYGLKKFVLKEPATIPTKPSTSDLNEEAFSSRYFSDILWAYNANVKIHRIEPNSMRQKVLGSADVRKFLSSADAVKKADAIYWRLASDIRPPMLKTFGWFLRKLWRTVYDKVVVDDEKMRELVKIRENSKTPILFLPTHRSYIDFLVISYILFSYGLEVPYIAAREDFLKMFLINHILRHSGAFFLRKNVGDDAMYQAIFSEYVK